MASFKTVILALFLAGDYIGVFYTNTYTLNLVAMQYGLSI
jgi:hypothetical protein